MVVRRLTIFDSLIDTLFVYSVLDFTLISGQSSLTVDKPTLKNSSVALLSVDGISENQADTSTYNIGIQYCTFTNNLLTGYNLLYFNGLPSPQVTLQNNFCIPLSSMPVCVGNNYYDPILGSCTGKELANFDQL